MYSLREWPISGFSYLFTPMRYCFNSNYLFFFHLPTEEGVYYAMLQLVGTIALVPVHLLIEMQMIFKYIC